MQTLERIKVLRDGSARRSEGHRDLYGYLSEANINTGYLSKGGMIATRLSYFDLRSGDQDMSEDKLCVHLSLITFQFQVCHQTMGCSYMFENSTR